MFSGISIFGSGSHYLGRLATLLGRFGEAADHLDRALAAHRAVGSRPYELRTLLAMADLARAEGRSADAARLAADARSLADGTPLVWLCGDPDRS